MALVRLRICAGSPEPSLLTVAISIKILCAGPDIKIYFYLSGFLFLLCAGPNIKKILADFLDFFYSRLDPKDLDVLLSEIVLLNTRAELYLRFVRRRLVVSYVNVTICFDP